MTRFQRILSIYQIIGGLLGVASGAIWLPAVALIPDGIVVLGVLFAASVFSVASGALVWRQSKLAFSFSCANQALQVPAISVLALTYKLGIGIVFIWSIEFAPGLNGAFRLGFPIELKIIGVAFNLSFGDTAQSTLIGINFVALVLLALIARGRNHFRVKRRGSNCSSQLNG